MVTLPEVRTEYIGQHRKYTTSTGDTKTNYCIQKRRTLCMDWPLKVVAFALVIALALFLAFLTPLWMTIPINIFLGYISFRIIVLGRLKIEKLNSSDIAKSLRDEAGECISMLNDLQRASLLTPEGSGIRARTDQYGSMLWRVMEKLESLGEANELVGGRGTAFYANITTLKTQLKDLERAGENLVEVTASKRMDSVMQDMEFIGIEEFKSQINEEAMIYRSLGTGTDLPLEVEDPLSSRQQIKESWEKNKQYENWDD